MDPRFKHKHPLKKALTLAIVLFSAVYACKPANRTPVPGVLASAKKSAVSPTVKLLTAAGRQVQVTVEIADHREAWEKGLMNRTNLEENSGMFFIFSDERPRTFWMKNTLISLDMVFIDSNYRVVGIVKNAAPQTLDLRSIGLPSRYVLEVNGGFTERYGVQKGDLIQFDPGA